MTAKTAIIIGGGIAGCSTAYALAQRGIKVTLLERNADIANEASGNPLAILYPRLSGNDASSQFALAAYLYSLKLYRSLDLSSADFNCCGMLQLGFNAKESARIERVAAQGYPDSILQHVNKVKTSEIAGIAIEHDALYFPSAAWVNPGRLCKQLTQHENISTLTQVNVSSIQNQSGLFQVHTLQNSVFTAEIVVIANANQAQQLYPNLPMNANAVRGQVSVAKSGAASHALKTIVCSDGYLSPAVSSIHTDRNHAASLHCLGATFSNLAITEVSPNDFAVTEDDHAANLQKLANISGTLYTELNNNIVSGRTSLRCTASDFWPLAGQLLETDTLKAKPPRPGADVNTLPWVNGLYMNIAHGSKGFTTAPLCAEMIACMVNKQSLPIPTELAGLLNPNRFLLKEMGLKRLAKMIRD